MKSLKKLILVVLVLNAILLSGRIWQEVHLARAGAPPVPAGNGDLNGDGDRDVSDAVYMLLWLFRNGPEPVALAAPSDVAAQAKSFRCRLPRRLVGRGRGRRGARLHHPRLGGRRVVLAAARRHAGP